ncbi:MAG: acetyl/propionyl/methylcrotonyl-CoA carboxylase subunit alpha [Rickettsiales bacterium]
MFGKILIANRGEIACRIIRTARKMGIKTVAVYSEADTNALHACMADEAVYIGPSSSVQSYLNVERLLGAIRATGAEAVHPGFGFLSENARFAEALAAEGVAFIGPDAHAIRAMGDKIEAKKLAARAKVSTVPGYMGTIRSPKEAFSIASAIGYPVMVKAAAGGGGKGMRIVHTPEEMERAYSSASNEARNSFADDRIFIEKYIERPRHIEIQLLGDKHGNILCLGERECSIQRHHQKVIEEAPSPFVTPDMRAKMYEQCVSLGREVGYHSAGTIEFIVDRERNFYFLEMNTRLQVEHPVTEMITGKDVVELMIRVAYGEKLDFAQEDVKLNGWAMECRVYAEDPSRGFLPSSGRIAAYREPEAQEGVRVDAGVYEGGEVSMFYDPMIAKLITHGENRAEAIAKMQRALGAYVIGGVANNLNFLEALISGEKFISGDIHTDYIAEAYPEGFSGNRLTSETARAFVAVAMHVYLQDAYRAAQISGQTPGRMRHIGNRWVVNIDGARFSVTVRPRDNGYDVKHESDLMAIRSSWALGSRLFHGHLDGRSIYAQVHPCPGGMYVTHRGSRAKVTVQTPRVAELENYMIPIDRAQNAKAVEAPISGMVVDVRANEGDEVKKGQELLILEAMKMENVICSERDGKIRRVAVRAGEAVAYGQLLMEFE